jgi:hypothetical protein
MLACHEGQAPAAFLLSEKHMILHDKITGECPCAQKMACSRCGIQLCTTPPAADRKRHETFPSADCSITGHYMYDGHAYCIQCFSRKTI